jgi:hypothetical protein
MLQYGSNQSQQVRTLRPLYHWDDIIDMQYQSILPFVQIREK